MENDKIIGRKYEFTMGWSGDEKVEECRTLFKDYLRLRTEKGDFKEYPKAIGHLIAIDEMELTDDLLFESAIEHFKDFLKEELQKEQRRKEFEEEYDASKAENERLKEWFDEF